MTRTFLFPIWISTTMISNVSEYSLKQKENSYKGDWILLIRQDFLFIDVDMGDYWIATTGKEEYNKYIKEKVKLAAFKEYCELKQKCKTKLKEVHYSECGG